MKNAWLVRPKPHGINRMNEFRSENIIAIGWPGIGDLSGKSREDLKKCLSEAPYNLSGLELGNAYATVDIMVNQMNVGDLLLVANGADIYFGQVASEYTFEPSAEAGGYSHQRKVEWFTNTSRNALSRELRLSLKVHRTLAKLSHHLIEIQSLATGTPPSEEPKNISETIQVTYPLRPSFPIEFKIPMDMTKAEAERLSTYFSSLYFTE